jgi:hypothetical protein
VGQLGEVIESPAGPAARPGAAVPAPAPTALQIDPALRPESVCDTGEEIATCPDAFEADWSHSPTFSTPSPPVERGD